MKKLLFVLLLIPATSFCQPSFLGKTIDSSKQIITEFEKYLSFKFIDQSHDSYRGVHQWFGEKGFCKAIMFFDQKKILQGSEVVSLPEKVTSISVIGPAERIDSVFNFFLKPIFKKGDKYTEYGYFIASSGVKAVWSDSEPHNTGIAMKSITIESY